ncbi:glycosyltransferase [Oscillospiraceae bacterium LTW-04]|nr:glycosyltransferase [Oscillospiraceae bacterium MB24-C1]
MNHRIAMVTTAHPHDDVRIYHKEAKALARAGWRVEIINSHFAGTDENGIRFCRVALPGGRLWRMLGARKAAVEALLKSRADICVLHDPELLPLLSYLQRMVIITVYDAHEDLPAQLVTKPWIPTLFSGTAARWGRRLLTRYLPLADGVLTATDGIAQTLEGLNNRICVVQNRPTQEDCALFDAARNSATPVPNAVCYAGALTEQRGLYRMIRCCYAAGATLMLAGAFENEAVQKKAEAMPEYTCVQYRGVLERQGIAELYAKCSAGLVLLADTPSYRESEPIKLFEYLCAGLPVIASDFLHWREIALTSGVTFVADNQDDEAVFAIRQAIAHPVEVDIKAARQKFGFKADEDRLLQFFDALEQKGRRQPSTF